MIRLSFLITVMYCLTSCFLRGQCDVDLFITNGVDNGDSYSFDIEIRSNIGDIVLADSDFNIVDADGSSNFTGAVSEVGIPGVSASGGGTTFFINFSAPPDFAPTVGATNTKITTLTIAGYDGGPLQIEWDGAIINYYDRSDNDRQVAIPDLCPFDLAEQNLPVELTHFTVQELGANTVQLDWGTASEIQNKGFEVQHSLDGIHWQVLDFVFGKGTTQLAQNYQYIHSEAEAGYNYYRLKQIDEDGAFTYSDIAFIELIASEFSFTVYPNPTTDVVNISFEQGAAKADLRLLDQSGRVLQIFKIADFTSKLSIQLGNYPSGVYYLQLNTGDKIINKKLVLQRT